MDRIQRVDMLDNRMSTTTSVALGVGIGIVAMVVLLALLFNTMMVL